MSQPGQPDQPGQPGQAKGVSEAKRPGRHERRLAPRLSALRDGELGRLRAALLRAHLRRCACCRQVMEQLDRQTLGLRQLAAPGLGEDRQHEPDPQQELDDAGWRALQAALRKDPGPVVPLRLLQRPAPLPARGRLARLPPPLAPLLALATLAGVVLLLRVHPARLDRLLAAPPSDDVIISLAEEQFRQAEQPYQRAVEQLVRVSAQARPGWDAAPGQMQVYDQTLRNLHDATERCRRAARKSPADAVAQERLYAAYRREIAFLQAGLFHGPALAQKDGLRQVSFPSSGSDGWEGGAP